MSGSVASNASRPVRRDHSNPAACNDGSPLRRDDRMAASRLVAGSSVQPEFRADRPEFGGLDEARVRHRHRVQQAV
jgi:hypothetical protein